MKKKWLSAHIYYGESFEPLLTKKVAPFIMQLKSEDKIEGYFFIRYWDKGPHLRLRIKGEPENLQEYVKPCLISTFTKFMAKFPSDRKEHGWIKNLPPGKAWHANNSIQLIEYKPEITRYGGLQTINLAEEHFQHSSDTILKILSSSDLWNYDRAMGTALQLHLSFAYAIGLNISQTRSFFNHVYSSWVPRAIQAVPAMSEEEVHKRKEKVLSAFKSTFEKQKDTLLPFIDTYWKLLISNTPFEKTWLNEWIDNVKKTDHEFKLKQKNGELSPPYKAPNNSKDRAMFERWSIFYSFIHMTNNRLGILNRDEGYLGYLLKEGLKNGKNQ